eukprot:3504503-Pyramimonas_sp.AAC.1
MFRSTCAAVFAATGASNRGADVQAWGSVLSAGWLAILAVNKAWKDGRSHAAATQSRRVAERSQARAVKQSIAELR